MQGNLQGCYESKWIVLLKVDTAKSECIRKILRTTKPAIFGDRKSSAKDDSSVSGLYNPDE